MNRSIVLLDRCAHPPLAGPARCRVESAQRIFEAVSGLRFDPAPLPSYRCLNGTHAHRTSARLPLPPLPLGEHDFVEASRTPIIETVAPSAKMVERAFNRSDEGCHSPGQPGIYGSTWKPRTSADGHARGSAQGVECHDINRLHRHCCMYVGNRSRRRGKAHWFQASLACTAQRRDTVGRDGF